MFNHGTLLRDTSQVDTAGCNTLPDNQTIITYNNGQTTTYKLISNKYVEFQRIPTTTSYSGYNCLTSTDVNTLPSPYDFITPFYYLAIAAVIITMIMIAYRLILHPFFRSKF